VISPGGALSVSGGRSTRGKGGEVVFTSGASESSSGDVALSSASTFTPAAATGTVAVSTGAAGGGGATGDLTLLSGSTQEGKAGDVKISAGSSLSGGSGRVLVEGGSVGMLASDARGSTSLQPGAGGSVELKDGAGAQRLTIDGAGGLTASSAVSQALRMKSGGSLEMQASGEGQEILLGHSDATKLRVQKYRIIAHTPMQLSEVTTPSDARIIEGES